MNTIAEHGLARTVAENARMETDLPLMRIDNTPSGNVVMAIGPTTVKTVAHAGIGIPIMATLIKGDAWTIVPFTELAGNTIPDTVNVKVFKTESEANAYFDGLTVGA